MDPAMTEALNKARKLEMDGIEFYGHAAEICGVPSGQRMFESFANDERRHLKIIGEVAQGMGVDIQGMPLPRDEIRTLFSDAEVKIDEYVETTADEKEAVRVAMGMEKESYELYTQSAERAGGGQVKDLFERLAVEENQHYEMLQNTLEYLESNEAWFLWNERGLIIGDQSTIGE